MLQIKRQYKKRPKQFPEKKLNHREYSKLNSKYEFIFRCVNTFELVSKNNFYSKNQRNPLRYLKLKMSNGKLKLVLFPLNKLTSSLNNLFIPFSLMVLSQGIQWACQVKKLLFNLFLKIRLLNKLLLEISLLKSFEFENHHLKG